MDFARPRILISKCLGFEKCRWDGNMVENSFIKKLGELVDFVRVCPECGIGLSTPRKPLRLVGKGDDVKMIQHETLKDFSEEMFTFSKKFVDNLGDIHGAILKSRSPSCGSRDSKVYPKIEDCPSSGKTSGLFAREFILAFSEVVVEDEKRLSNLKIRENFLTWIFCFAELDSIKNEIDLRKFHYRYFLLLKSYDRFFSDKLVGVLKSEDSFEAKKEGYRKILNRVFSKGRDDMNYAKVVRELFLELVDNENEREFFEDEFLKFKNSKLKLDELRVLLEDLAVRKDRDLLRSRFFVSFPKELVDLVDSARETGIHFDKERD